MKVACPECGHRVFAKQDVALPHDTEGRTWPKTAPAMPTGEVAKKIRDRRRGRIARALAAWESRVRCAGVR